MINRPVKILRTNEMKHKGNLLKKSITLTQSTVRYLNKSKYHLKIGMNLNEDLLNTFKLNLIYKLHKFKKTLNN